MKTKLPILSAVLLTAGFANAQTIVFTEAFNNPLDPKVDTGLSQIDWKANISANATVMDTNSNPSLSPILSSQQYIFFNPNADNANIPWIAWTEKTSVNNIGAINNVTEVSVGLNNQNTTTENIRIALRVGTDWFVSNVNLNGGAYIPAKTVDVQNTAWSSLTLNPGTSLSLGSTIALPSSGNVTAVGVFNAGTATPDNRVRVDNFTVAIPEPATAALLFGALAGLMLLRRRRG